jgi:hypothetical protein
MVLMLVTGVGFVLLHPQASLNYLILLVAIAVTQSAAAYRWETGALVDSRRVHGYVVLIAVVFLLWNLNHWQMFVNAQNTIEALVNTITGNAQVGEVVTQQTTDQKRQQVGFTIPELFGKLFFVEAVYCLLTAGIVGRFALAKRRNSAGEHPDCEAAITYLTVGGLALLPFFLLQFLGAVSSYFFRHVGFGMVLVTVLGSIGLYSFLAAPPRLPGKRFARPALVVAGVVLLALSMSTVISSPFIYKATPHADEQQLRGWESSFEEQPPRVVGEYDRRGRVWYGPMGTAIVRYQDALAHRPGTSWYPGRYPARIEPQPISSGPVTATNVSGGLVDHYRTSEEAINRRDHYVPISEMGKQREVVAYRELNYRRQTYRSLRNQRGVHRIQTNGGFTVYYVDLPESDPMTDYPLPGNGTAQNGAGGT